MHSDYTALMSLMLDGEATEVEGARLHRHLASCGVCALTWQRWQELDRQLGLARAVPAPAGLAAGVMARLELRQAEQSRRRWFMLGLALAWCAVIVVALLALGVANGWHLRLLQLQGPLAAAWSGLSSGGSWLARQILSLVDHVGAPAVAAATGALLCMACGLAVAWLWVVARLTAPGQAALARVK